MKRAVYILILGLLFVNISCQNNSSVLKSDEDCNYYNCDGNEPFFAVLEIKISRTSETPNPIIYVLEGNFEQANYIDTIETSFFDSNISEITYTVPLNHNYTLLAEYFRANDTIAVLDKQFVHKKVRTVCDSLCWKVHNTDFDLRLMVK